jgi:hypothetical protein
LTFPSSSWRSSSATFGDSKVTQGPTCLGHRRASGLLPGFSARTYEFYDLVHALGHDQLLTRRYLHHDRRASPSVLLLVKLGQGVSGPFKRRGRLSHSVAFATPVRLRPCIRRPTEASSGALAPLRRAEGGSAGDKRRDVEALHA